MNTSGFLNRTYFNHPKQNNYVLKGQFTRNKMEKLLLHAAEKFGSLYTFSAVPVNMSGY